MIRLDGVGVWSELLLSVYGVFVLLVTLAGGSICFGGSGVAVCAAAVWLEVLSTADAVLVSRCSLALALWQNSNVGPAAVWWFFVFPNSCFCCNRTIGGFFIEFC
jgi:hypothetical protein